VIFSKVVHAFNVRMVYSAMLPTLVAMGMVYLSEAVLLDSVKNNHIRRLIKRHAADEQWGQENHPKQEMCYTIPHLQALKSQFAEYIDSNGDEKASRDEILDYLQKYNPTTSQEQLDNFIRRRDMDGDGSVDFIPDYLMEVSSPDYDLKTAQEWFELEDTNGDNEVSARELMAIAVKVGMTKEEAKKAVLGYYMSADTNGDGKLSWEEYKPLFTI